MATPMVQEFKAPPKKFARPRVDGDEEKRKILDKIGIDLRDIERLCFGNRVLVAKWVPEKQGSLYTGRDTENEHKWQGKTGLVLYVGPAAFQDDPQAGQFYGAHVEIGEWVHYRASDGRDADFQPDGSFEKIPCRILLDVEIAGVIPRPDFWY